MCTTTTTWTQTLQVGNMLTHFNMFLIFGQANSLQTNPQDKRVQAGAAPAPLVHAFVFHAGHLVKDFQRARISKDLQGSAKPARWLLHRLWKDVRNQENDFSQKCGH